MNEQLLPVIHTKRRYYVYPKVPYVRRRPVDVFATGVVFGVVLVAIVAGCALWLGL